MQRAKVVRDGRAFNQEKALVGAFSVITNLLSTHSIFVQFSMSISILFIVNVQVDSSGVHVNNQGNYGFCSTDAACTTSVAPKAGLRRAGGGAVNFGRPARPQ